MTTLISQAVDPLTTALDGGKSPEGVSEGSLHARRRSPRAQRDAPGTSGSGSLWRWRRPEFRRSRCGCTRRRRRGRRCIPLPMPDPQPGGSDPAATSPLAGRRGAARGPRRPAWSFSATAVRRPSRRLCSSPTRAPRSARRGVRSILVDSDGSLAACRHARPGPPGPGTFYEMADGPGDRNPVSVASMKRLGEPDVVGGPRSSWWHRSVALRRRRRPGSARDEGRSMGDSVLRDA